MKLQPITRANRPARKEVLMGEQQAAELIKDGDVIIVGGYWHREPSDDDPARTIRRKVKNLTVIGAATAGLEIDLMIGAGCVRKVIAPYIGAELHARSGIAIGARLRTTRSKFMRQPNICSIRNWTQPRADWDSCHGAAGSAPRSLCLTPTTFRSTIRSMASLILLCLRSTPTGPFFTLDRLTRTVMASMAVRDLATACCRAG